MSGPRDRESIEESLSRAMRQADEHLGDAHGEAEVLVHQHDHDPKILEHISTAVAELTAAQKLFE